MVLRGAPFQGSGPARCKFPTRQAPSSHIAASCTDIRLDSTAEINASNFTEDSRRMAREGDVCHGDIGESSSGLQPW
jgi:hypothetical protein